MDREGFVRYLAAIARVTVETSYLFMFWSSIKPSFEADQTAAILTNTIASIGYYSLILIGAYGWSNNNPLSLAIYGTAATIGCVAGWIIGHNLVEVAFMFYVSTEALLHVYESWLNANDW